MSRRYAAKSPFWSWLLFERIGGALAYLFARLGVPPAAATLLGGASGIAGALLLGTAGESRQLIVAGVFLLLAYSLDCSDGQLARATNRASARGAWLDVSTDAVVIAFVTSALCSGLQANGGAARASLLLAGLYGASRTASLFTSTVVRRDDGGMALSGALGVVRTMYTAAMDTPFVYVALCASRLNAVLFPIVIVSVSVLTVGQMILSARHHFGSLPEVQPRQRSMGEPQAPEAAAQQF